MSTPILKGMPSELELQYAKLKKQADIENDSSQTKNKRKELASARIVDMVTLSSQQPDADNPTKRKPSQPVTTDEIQALLTHFSVKV